MTDDAAKTTKKVTQRELLGGEWESDSEAPFSQRFSAKCRKCHQWVEFRVLTASDDLSIWSSKLHSKQ